MDTTTKKTEDVLKRLGHARMVLGNAIIEHQILAVRIAKAQQRTQQLSEQTQHIRKLYHLDEQKG